MAAACETDLPSESFTRPEPPRRLGHGKDGGCRCEAETWLSKERCQGCSAVSPDSADSARRPCGPERRRRSPGLGRLAQTCRSDSGPITTRTVCFPGPCCSGIGLPSLSRQQPSRAGRKPDPWAGPVSGTAGPATPTGRHSAGCAVDRWRPWLSKLQQHIGLEQLVRCRLPPRTHPCTVSPYHAKDVRPRRQPAAGQAITMKTENPLFSFPCSMSCSMQGRWVFSRAVSDLFTTTMQLRPGVTIHDVN